MLATDPQSNPVRRARGREVALPAAALVLLTLLAYQPAMDAGFVWDDDANVTENLPLRSAEGLRALWLQPGSTTQYYPLVYTSFWIEHWLWELEPKGYHVDNILLHAANALLLWRLMVLLGVSGAWLVAAVFALLLGGVLAWVVTRTDMPGTSWLRPLLIVPYVVPSFAIALAWETLFKSPRIGGLPGLYETVLGFGPPEWLSYGPAPIIISKIPQVRAIQKTGPAKWAEDSVSRAKSRTSIGTRCSKRTATRRSTTA